MSDNFTRFKLELRLQCIFKNLNIQIMALEEARKFEGQKMNETLKDLMTKVKIY
jgi:hypothetical protein